MKPVTETTTEAIIKTTTTITTTTITTTTTSTRTTTEVITKMTTENITFLIRGPKKAARQFDGWSFFGGILSTVGIMAIALVAYKYFIAKRSRTSNLNYSLM